jgi:hypothetical protein
VVISDPSLWPCTGWLDGEWRVRVSAIGPLEAQVTWWVHSVPGSQVLIM